MAVFSPRWSPFCCALWCVSATKAMRTVCCSCRHHERSRRSLRRRATPQAGGRRLDSSINSQLHFARRNGSQNMSEPGGGCWLLVVGCWLLVVRLLGCWLLVVGCGCWLFVVGCWLLVVGCWLFVVCCLLFVVRCSLFVVRLVLSGVCCMLLLNG